MMRERPTIAILSIVAGLDVISGYSMWMGQREILANRRLYLIVLFGILVTQLLVSNFLVVSAAAVGLLFSRQIETTVKITHRGALVVPLGLLTIGYVFCTLMMLLVMTR
ncbi:hypothetical protein [Lacticaseibacillus zeae]|uniref:hypothetical protein n=1 Tax=Lacticaseibacillus zeae TaxID=57037 RepID=UPI002078CB66|nr:hypothetical protein [Lacticaseibacillus zeae]